MKQDDFRKELVKVMPGYKWTVHRGRPFEGTIIATGIQTSGSNRLSTLRVERREREGVAQYEAKSAGFGLRAPWLHKAAGKTLANALRSLQEHYEREARKFLSHASDLQAGRTAIPEAQGGAA